MFASRVRRTWSTSSRARTARSTTPDIIDGTIQRIAYPAGDHAPTARATATPDHGSTPLTVQFSGTTSSDPDNDPLTYSWDLNGDGTFGDSAAPTPTFTYTTPGNYTIRLRVSDPAGNTDTIDASRSRPATRRRL